MTENPATSAPSATTAAASSSSAVPPPAIGETKQTAQTDDQSATRVQSPPTSFNTDESAPVCLREIAAVVLIVVLADVTLFRGNGYTGYALLFAGVPILLRGAVRSPQSAAARWLVALMLLILAARLVWLGSAWLVAAGFALLAAFAVTLAGRQPYVVDVLIFGLHAPLAGAMGLRHYVRSADEFSLRGPRATWLKFGLPLATVAGFGTLFVLANPDVATAVGEWLEWFFRSLWDALRQFAPTAEEVLFWIIAALVACGLLRPLVHESVFSGVEQASRPPSGEMTARSSIYPAFRNTLGSVIVLFAAYLVFEYKTLWLRDFPDGFYYAGYAHEGAAWLTVALALSTFVLSMVFRGQVLHDLRLPRLRRLAWVWSAENILLALAVYNRMYIYIDFNGMTRMRTLGLFGISAVLVGFILVVCMILYGKGVVWLLRRQLWTLAVAVYLLAITPVDFLVHSYNVRRVLAGDSAPSVQISVHPVDAGGVLVLPPLMNSDDPIIREGIRAMLAERTTKLERRAEGQAGDWTRYQLAERKLGQKLAEHRSAWQKYNDANKRRAALKRFDDYVYQWY